MTRSTQAPVVAPVDAEAAVDGAGAAVPGADKPLRADARRNRDTLLETAAALFEQRGIEVPLEEIARQAEGRHRHAVPALPDPRRAHRGRLPARGRDALQRRRRAARRPRIRDAALAAWMRSFAVYVARKRGMATALKSMMGVDSELFTQSRQSIQHAIDTLVTRPWQAGRIRGDVDPADLLRALSGICMANDQPGFSEQTARIVDLLLDGLRYGAPNPVRA